MCNFSQPQKQTDLQTHNEWITFTSFRIFFERWKCFYTNYTHRMHIPLSSGAIFFHIHFSAQLWRRESNVIGQKKSLFKTPFICIFVMHKKNERFL